MILLFAFISLAVSAQNNEDDYHSRMQWWNEGRLGLFIHWGAYSCFEGEYNGNDYGKEMGQASAEWIYLRANIPQDEYIKAAQSFNPQKYDATEWVRMAKEAGMKYMVLTAKHHDGFALFNTKASEWNALESSGLKKDLIKEYVDACHDQGMRVGFYYSHEKDWFHHSRSTRDATPLSEEYKALVRTQLKELLTNYGRIDLIWFDTPVKEHAEFNRECAGIVRELQPDCIINGRIGGDLGDYQNIGDRTIVHPGKTGYMESIMTMRLNWGYDKNDDFWKSSDEIIGMLCKSACRGSNFLLNVGPSPEGSFTPEDRSRLRDLGNWMKKNGEAVYNTAGSPYSKEYSWGSITSNKKNKTIYLHLWNWHGGPINARGIESKVMEAYFLDNEEKIKIIRDSSDSGLTLLLPKINSMHEIRIVCLKLEDEVSFDTENGPDFIDNMVHHVTRRELIGKLTDIDGATFTIQGRIIISTKQGSQIHEQKETTKHFSINNHLRYRVSENGEIKLVHGFDLVKGKNYSVVFSPYEAGDVLEIVTEIK